MTVGRYTTVKYLGGDLRQYNAGDKTLAAIARLEGVKSRSLNLSVPFQAFIPLWHQQERRVFESQGLPLPWPALSPLYAEWKAKHFPGKTILRRTDQLYASLTGGQRGVAEAAPRTLRLGTHVPWWIYHQLGTGRLPRRPPVVMLPETFRRLAQMTMRWIMRGTL